MSGIEEKASLETTRVSVIVRTRDRRDLLVEALESLRAQSFRDFEAVVVNDSDKALDPSVAASFADLRVRVVRPDPPHGRARAANAGVEAARGEWIAYLDDDDLFLPDHLATLVETLDGQDACQAAYTDALLVHQALGTDGLLHETGRERIFECGFDPVRLVFSNTIPLLCLMHRRSLFEQAGRFDETFDLYEDWDFLIRLSRLTPIRKVARTTALYRMRDDGTNATAVTPWRGEVSELARLQIFRKHWRLHTPEAELGLLNLHEDAVGAVARQASDLQRRLKETEANLVPLRLRLGELEALVKETGESLAKEREQRASGELAARLEREKLEAEITRLREERDRLDGERLRLEGVVDQMTNSLVWRLFTPWWKLKSLLERKG